MTETRASLVATLFDSLRAQPLVLALLVFNLCFFYLVYSATQHAQERHAALMTEMINRCWSK